MGTPDLAIDPRFATHTTRGENQKEIEGRVAVWAQQYSSAELADRLKQAAVPSAIVYTVADIVADPLFTEREMLLDT